jgi:hypothetical protein
MSVYLDVFLDRSKLPDFGEWAREISREGFPLTFPERVNIAKHIGYLPALLGNEECGFEFSLSDIDEPDGLPDEVRALRPTTNSVAQFRFHEACECHAATAAAAVLANLTDGVFFDPQGGMCLDGQEAIVQARTDLEAAAKKDVEDVAIRGKLSPRQWAQAFEQTLQRVNPAYRLSKDYCGRLVECVREDEMGLILSQNCVKMYDDYRHCFAVLLTCAKLGPALNSPFVLGSRFDHNSTVAHAYNRDFRAGSKWQVAPMQCQSEYRATLHGTQQWVESTAKSAEQFLFPLYVDWLSQGADRVASLFRDAAEFIKRWAISKETMREPLREGELLSPFAAEFGLTASPREWNEGLVVFYNALCMANMNGWSGTLLLKHRRAAINVNCTDIALVTSKIASIPVDVRHAAVFVAYVEDFLTVREELPRMIQVLENLARRHSQPSEEAATSRKPWWRFW